MRIPRILIAHPELELGRRLSYLSEQANPCQLRLLANGYAALDAALEWLPDLFLLGIDLVGLDGFELCCRLRSISQFSDVPFVFLLPPEEKAERYRAYLLGAEDIIDLPFDDLELVYRLRIQLRRRRLRSRQEPMRDGTLRIDPATHVATLDARECALTPSEYAILSTLVNARDRVMSTEELLVEALGASPQLGNPQLVHTHIRNLRRKLEEDPTNPRLLRFIRRGYQWFSPSPGHASADLQRQVDTIRTERKERHGS